MILEIEGKRVQVDDSFAKLSPEEQERQVQEIAQSLFPKQEEKAAPKEEKTVAETLNEAVYPVGGAVAGAGLEAKRGLGRFAQNLARASNPELMAEAKLKADLNAVEKYGRTQHRVPGMPSEKPGLYFGQPTYELETKRAREEIAKMIADPEYQKKVLAEQKPQIAQYQKRVSPSMGQRAANFLGRTPLGILGGAAVGAGAGMQAADAVNRYNKGDTLGAVIGGLGTLGTGLAMVPTPLTRVGGTALSLGAEGLNAYIDILKKNNPLERFLQNNPLAPVGEFQNKQQEQQFMQQNPPAPPPPQNRAQPMPVRMKEGGSVKGYDDGGLVEPMAMSFASPMMASFDPLTTQTTDMPMLKSAQMDMLAPMAMAEPFMVNDSKFESLPYQINDKSAPMPFYRSDMMQPTMFSGGFDQPMAMSGMQPMAMSGMQPMAMSGMQPRMLSSAYGQTMANMPTPRLPRLRRHAFGIQPMGQTMAPLNAMSLPNPNVRRLANPVQSGYRPIQNATLPRPRRRFAEGGEVFDPEGSGYDYKTALAYGMGPDGEGEDLGHWGSVAPTSDDERMLKDLPRDSYVMLKGKAHETFKKAEEAEKKRGSKTVKSGERYYSVPEYEKGGSTTPAWQRSEGKNPEGGLNAAGRASYNRQTGGNLKAPQPEGGPRKKSFCARMSGMKKKLTSSKTANDPDSRINKALRKWKC